MYAGVIMEPDQIAYFKKVLADQLEELTGKAEETLNDMEAAPTNFPDPTDRAMQESDATRELRIRDRERKLISKIREALARIQSGTFGTCELCEEPIDIDRLRARPVTTLCIECKIKQEELEKRQKL